MKTMMIAVLSALLLFGCAGNGAAPPANAGSNASGTPSGGISFSGSQYASSAVEVYPGTTNGASSAEVQGFDMATAQQSDGSTRVTMTERAGGQALAATVPIGGSLYFNDANPGDDATGQDKYLQDDKLIVVDKNGYIVQ